MTLSDFWLGFKVWIAYALPFLPYVPQIGSVRESDCIFVQAFGRNAIPDDRLGKELWTLRSRVNFSDAETFALLRKQGFDVGASNRALADRAVTLASAHLFHIPIIAQWEVVYAISGMHPEWYEQNAHLIDCIWPPQEGYFATYHVKRISVERMRARGRKRPLELAHPAMLARAVPIIWKCGARPCVEGIRPWNFWRNELWVWDDFSVQPWTRRFLPHLVLTPRDLIRLWIVRESLGRVHHIIHRFVALLPPR